MKESTTYEPGTYDQETFRPNGARLDLPSPLPAPTLRPGVKRTVFALASTAPIALAAFALYVWPTPYQTYSQNGNTLRVNRFTGKTQALAATGWTTPSDALPKSLDSTLLGKLSVDDSLITRGNLHTRIYNGTNSRLSGVTLLVTILNKDRTVKMERPYLAHPEDAGNGGPYGDDDFGARCNVSLGAGETSRITVAGATGIVTPGLSSVDVTANAPAAPPAPAPAAPVRPVVIVAASPKAVPVPPVQAAPPVHTLPLSAGTTPPHPVPPLASAINAPTAQPLPKTPSAITPTVIVNPALTGGLTPLQISSLQQRYDTFKRDGKFATDPRVQAWCLAALARNVVHDDNQADLSKVPTSVLQDSLHMINTYKPADFLR